jgi:hypothetical protein
VNDVTVSEDGMELVIRSGDRKASVRSARKGGFTADHIEYARSFPFNSHLIPGQVDRARLFRIAGKPFFVHVNTGPPTWWYPRVELKRGKVMVGWFRLLVALSWEA